MDKIKPISRERIEEIEKIITEVGDQLKDVPHIIMLTATDKNDDAKLWTHHQISASGNEVMSMFIELMKNNPQIVNVMERAIEWYKITEKHGETPPLSILLTEALKNTLKDIEDNGPSLPDELKDFLKELHNDLKGNGEDNKTGDTDDVDELLRRAFDNDEEGDKQD